MSTGASTSAHKSMTPLSDFSQILLTHFQNARNLPSYRSLLRVGATERAREGVVNNMQAITSHEHTHTPGVPRVQTKQGSRCSVKLFVRDVWHDIYGEPQPLLLRSVFYLPVY